MTINLFCLGSVCEEVQYPITELDTQAQNAKFWTGREVILNAELNYKNGILMMCWCCNFQGVI